MPKQRPNSDWKWMIWPPRTAQRQCVLTKRSGACNEGSRHQADSQSHHGGDARVSKRRENECPGARYLVCRVRYTFKSCPRVRLYGNGQAGERREEGSQNRSRRMRPREGMQKVPRGKDGNYRSSDVGRRAATSGSIRQAPIDGTNRKECTITLTRSCPTCEMK